MADSLVKSGVVGFGIKEVADVAFYNVGEVTVDPTTGKIPPRLVNVESDKIQQVINNLLHYVTPEDYEAAKAYVANPEAYDFKKILNW